MSLVDELRRAAAEATEKSTHLQAALEDVVKGIEEVQAVLHQIGSSQDWLFEADGVLGMASQSAAQTKNSIAAARYAIEQYAAAL
ncbi:hypothetical protein [Saccharopolyspora cebuensis]|uniref:Uncharacterized protein n=1 Tax=Saccharopolyspora cebuensis TaxID=418759 RepID=A0ABV4CIY1_9PSEU